MHDVINQLFEARSIAHRLHLGAKSFAKHIALEELYEKLTDKTDELAEVYQGQYGLMQLNSTDLKASLNETDPILFIQDLARWVTYVKQFLSKEDTHILNIWDEITSIVYRAKYKLENLQ